MINIDTYKIIANLIEEIQSSGEYISSSLYKSMTNFENNEVRSDNVDKERLFNELTRTYEDLTSRYSLYSKAILDFVEELQIHVRNEYGSVNNFLRDNGERVGPIFADISYEVGFEITGDLIESYSDLCTVPNPSSSG
jgi:hypothetical protein